MAEHRGLALPRCRLGSRARGQSTPQVVGRDVECGEIRQLQARSIATCVMTALCCTAWNGPIGAPNWWRCLTCSSTRSNTRWQAPTVVTANPVNARCGPLSRSACTRSVSGSRRREGHLGDVRHRIEDRAARRMTALSAATRNTPASVTTARASRAITVRARVCGAVEHPPRGVATPSHRREPRCRPVRRQTRSPARRSRTGSWSPSTASDQWPCPVHSSDRQLDRVDGIREFRPPLVHSSSTVVSGRLLFSNLQTSVAGHCLVTASRRSCHSR